MLSVRNASVVHNDEEEQDKWAQRRNKSKLLELEGPPENSPPLSGVLLNPHLLKQVALLTFLSSPSSPSRSGSRLHSVLQQSHLWLWIPDFLLMLRDYNWTRLCSKCRRSVWGTRKSHQWSSQENFCELHWPDIKIGHPARTSVKQDEQTDFFLLAPLGNCSEA